MIICEIYWGIMDIMIYGKMIISNHLSIILPIYHDSNITIDQQYYEIHWDIIWLVVWTLKSMTSSVGIMTFPTEWKVIKFLFQSTNQLWYMTHITYYHRSTALWNILGYFDGWLILHITITHHFSFSFLHWVPTRSTRSIKDRSCSSFMPQNKGKHMENLLLSSWLGWLWLIYPRWYPHDPMYRMKPCGSFSWYMIYRYFMQISHMNLLKKPSKV